MPRHSFGQTRVDRERVVKTLREKMKEGGVSPAECINIVGPVDEQAAPDHDGQQWKVDPVEPANGGGMLGLDLPHEAISFLKTVIDSNDRKVTGADQFSRRPTISPSARSSGGIVNPCTNTENAT